jgi:hypothetical protein
LTPDTVTRWAARPPAASGASVFCFFFLGELDGHGDFGTVDVELDGSMIADSGAGLAVPEVTPPATPALDDGPGVLTDPGSGVEEMLVGGADDTGDVGVSDGVTDGDGDVGALLAGADGDELADTLGVGVALPVLELPSALHRDAGGAVLGA